MVVKTDQSDRLSVRSPEAAEMLGVSERTLQRWTLEGIVPSAKVGNVRLYRVETLQRWLREREGGAEQERGG